jgi:hypothetical protein
MEYKWQIVDLIESSAKVPVWRRRSRGRGYALRSASLTLLGNLLWVIKMIWNHFPELAPPIPQVWLNIALRLMQVPDSEVQVSAVSAAMYTALYMGQFEALCRNVFDLIQRAQDANVVELCFDSFCLLLEQDITLSPELVRQMVLKACAAIRGSLMCQTVRPCEMENVYCFLRLLFYRNPEEFPLTMVLACYKELEGAHGRQEELMKFGTLLSLIVHHYCPSFGVVVTGTVADADDLMALNETVMVGPDS